VRDRCRPGRGGGEMDFLVVAFFFNATSWVLSGGVSGI